MTGCRARASCSRRAMARQLHRTKWALAWASVTHSLVSARVYRKYRRMVSEGRGCVDGSGCQHGQDGRWPTWLDGGRRPQRSGVCGFCTIQLNLHAYLRYRVCGCRLIKLFVHARRRACRQARRCSLFSIQFQLQPDMEEFPSFCLLYTRP